MNIHEKELCVNLVIYKVVIEYFFRNSIDIIQVSFLKRVNQSHYRPGWEGETGEFQEVKVPRFRDNGTVWW